MSSVARHYADHLAPIYVWMAGGFEQALSAGESDVRGFLGAVDHAVDLGAGFGMHAIPLARAGADVLAIDSSEHLLSALSRGSDGLPIRTVQADLSDFAAYVDESPDLILCMGDTLTHLGSPEDVERLIRAVASALRPGGSFLATFRDYRSLPSGEGRFIPVRSDDTRIHTCFLEELPGHVRVHDLIHERTGEQWQMRVSSYLKLRLSPDDVVAWAAAAGLRCTLEPGPRGMVRLRADASRSLAARG